MLRDVFYRGDKPNVHPREQFAESLEDARQKCTTDNFWIINEFCDYRGFDWDFDFEFLPDEDVWAEKHNNVWPSQHQKDSGTWLCPKEYSDVIIYRGDVNPVLRKNLKSDNWVELDLIGKFDFSWHPDPTDPPYIYKWGCKFFPAQIKPVLEYHVPNATEVKYMTTTVELLIEEDRWVEVQPIDKHKFDMSWRPDPREPPFIYIWGNKWIDAKDRPTLEYHTPGATDIKYMGNNVPVLPEKNRWRILTEIDNNSFDFTWRPDPREPPFTYVFGNEFYDAVKMPTVMYTVPEGTEIKYTDVQKAKLASDPSKYEHLEDSFLNDYSWMPDPAAPPYIYVWGNQWNKPEDKISVQYVVPGATEYRYMEERATRRPCMDNWAVLGNVNTERFDFSWEPHSGAPPYIYVFGNQWFSAEKEPTIEYRMPGAINKKYVNDIIAMLDVNMDNWEVPENIDTSKFDFSWHPDPDAPPYIYQFGTIVDNNDGPRYITPGNGGEIVYLERVEPAEIKTVEVKQYYIDTTLDNLVNQHPDEIFWAMRKNIDYSSFDFGWRPGTVEVAWELDYVHTFGSTESEVTQTYFISAKNYLGGNTNLKFVEELNLDESTLSKIFVKPDMFFVDRNNIESAARFEALKARFGSQIQKTRYLNSWVDTINRCTNRSTTEMIWILNSELDYSDFDFEYYPNPWQMQMVQVFGTQWSHWGTTFMVNCNTFSEDTKYIKIIEHLSNLNFVKNIKARATECVHDIVLIDHGNNETDKVIELLKTKAPNRNVTVVNYKATYFITIKDIISRQLGKKENFIWICSSVCDYTDFDFSYVCDPFAKDNLHVFPSDTQKFGDTFFVNVNKTHEVIVDMQSLEDHHNLNFNSTVRAKRLPEPIIVTHDDTHINAVAKITGFPYATIITADNVGIETPNVEPMNLWSPNTKNIIITSTGATRIIVPSEAKDIVTNELYDYPYIKRMPKLTKSAPLDIVFVSNGETVADQNYEHLLEFTRGLPNKLHRVDGINGRTKALHAAADSSETPWFFCVPAKLFINKKFDWNYQADRMQMPKHYIFNALNPVNDLFYGHQSMVLYNKNLVLGNEGVGLDFTLDSPHMSVELNSGTVLGDTDEYSTWRTAFREAVKLKHYSESGDDVATTRLGVWTSVGKGNYGEWSIKGAEDGIEFYNEVNGDLPELRQSYYWDWLRTRYESKY